MTDTVRAEAAARPRADQLTEIRLSLTDVLRPLRIDMTLALSNKAYAPHLDVDFNPLRGDGPGADG